MPSLTLRPLAVIGLAALLAACQPGATPAPVVGDVRSCPEANWLTLADYQDDMVADGLNADELDYAEFLVANGKRDGVVTTESGLQYKVIRPGIKGGYKPAVDEDVTVHYHGYFADGPVFDSSYERGETISFAPNRVIGGWTEALTDMQPCEARILYIPGDLAYKAEGRPGIPPNATLLFNLQMLGVN